MDTKSEIAIEIFSKGFNCAQAVLASHSSDFGMDSATARKVAGAFGGGMAYSGEACGAVTGALMLIGLKYGMHIEGDKDSKEKTYRIASEFISKFKKEYGSVKCTDLIKYDLAADETLKKAREAGVFKTICPLLVKRAVELAEELL